MHAAQENLVELPLEQPATYINRELSLLAFNERVLELANDLTIPLLERLKFLCISCSNLDEFFEIKLAGLKQQADLGLSETGPDGLTPAEILAKCTKRARQLIKRQYQCLNKDVMPALEAENIRFVHAQQFSDAQVEWAQQWFEENIMPVVTPIRLDPAHPFPRTINKGLCLIVELNDPERNNEERGLDIAIIPAPRTLPRLIPIPKLLSQNKESSFSFLASLMKVSAGKLFPGLEIRGVYSFSRDTQQ